MQAARRGGRPSSFGPWKLWLTEPPGGATMLQYYTLLPDDANKMPARVRFGTEERRLPEAKAA